MSGIESPGGRAVLRQVAVALDSVAPLLAPGWRAAIVLVNPNDVDETVVVGNVSEHVLVRHIEALRACPDKTLGFAARDGAGPLKHDETGKPQ